MSYNSVYLILFQQQDKWLCSVISITRKPISGNIVFILHRDKTDSSKSGITIAIQKHRQDGIVSGFVTSRTRRSKLDMYFSKQTMLRLLHKTGVIRTNTTSAKSDNTGQRTRRRTKLLLC
ncbi:MAG TPA: hypothetical protein VE076_11820 [Nitrososphaeraceae archaeon]|nr:hypothetical protein [Nitrososphaeraceae archaeon]